ncbi:dynein light chain Tctex-type 4 isoform X2 [Drosophila montana]|uniref:dynein light chain Tctex-type 4 isoform X2 n=1 Tax=Drosophila montana TaxID=40370 RepID=UPI00313A9840
MASAAQNWSGLVTLCLGQEREQRQTSSQRTSLTKSNVAAALGAPSKATVRYMPSYRLEPKNPLNKERLELTMRAIMNKNYNDDYLFHPRQSYHLAAQVSEEIKNSIKLLNFDRYRYVVLVTVGELLMQGLCSMVNFLWDADKDGFVTYTIETPKFVAVCTIFYLYYD